MAVTALLLVLMAVNNRIVQEINCIKVSIYLEEPDILFVSDTLLSLPQEDDDVLTGPGPPEAMGQPSGTVRFLERGASGLGSHHRHLPADSDLRRV